MVRNNWAFYYGPFYWVHLGLNISNSDPTKRIQDENIGVQRQMNLGNQILNLGIFGASC